MAEDQGRRPGGEDPHATGPTAGGDRAEELLRGALRAQAAAVDPGEAPRVDELDDRRPQPRRWTAALAVAASVAVVAAATALALPGDDPGTAAVPAIPPSLTSTMAATTEATTGTSTEATTGTTAEPPADAAPATSEPAPDGSAAGAPTEAGTSTGAAPTGEDAGTATGGGGGETAVVVWATRPDDDALASPLMVPERRTGPLPAGSGMTATEARVASALEVLLTREPLDPDYDNPWAAGEGTREPVEDVDVAVADDGTTVDFSSPPQGLDSGYYVGVLAEQLVRTVVSNGGTQPVTFLVDGETRPFVQLDWSEPVRTGGVPLVGGWILDPWDGQRVAAGPLTVSGTATAFEANVEWEVTDADGDVVDSGFTMAGANGEYGPFSFSVDLSPGTYTVAVREPSMADLDEGPAVVWQDTKTVTVVD